MSRLAPKGVQGLIKRVGHGRAVWRSTSSADPRAAACIGMADPTTQAGCEAQSIWAPLTDEIEARWNDRFSQKAVEDLARLC